jgi:uncharacterized protein
MIANGQVNEIVTKIARNYKPDRIILFGSNAMGNSNEDSDLDFILIKDTGLPKHKRGLEVRKLFYGLPVPMDLKIYSSQEFQVEQSNKYSFLNSALKNSKTLYERKV